MDTDQQYADRLLMKDTSPLKIVVSTYEEGRGSETGVQGREGSVIGVSRVANVWVLSK